jgi:ABC-2 type transport system ATP-binding protein
VLTGFSWQVPAGRTVILGPNGAGKTTLLSLGATVLQPQGGRITFGELDASRAQDRARMRRAIGWMPQQTRPIPGFTAREQVAYAGWLKGLPRSAAWEAALVGLDRVGLAAEARHLTSELSGGQQRRIGLAQCLVHDAEMLVLDEPSVGLDPAQRVRFRDILAELGRHSAVLVSTHVVDDLADLFDSVVVLDHGCLRFQGSIRDFMARAPSGGERAGESAYATLIRGEQ